MATSFPTALDALTNPAPKDKVNIVSHSARHSDANDAIEALQVKVGIDGSANIDSIDYKINNITKITLESGETILSGQLIYDDTEAYKASYDNEESCIALLGVALNNASASQQVTVQTFGEVTNTGWAWNMSTDRTLYLGISGEISQGYPASPNYSQKIGFVLSSTEIFIRIQDYVTINPPSDFLLETGDALLLETNDKLLLEAA